MPHRLVTPPRLFASALCCAMSVSVVAGTAAVEPKRSYNLPSGDAATTLNQFAGASGQQILFMMDKVKGERTNAIIGDYAARDALDHMLAGTGLSAARDPVTGAFVVSRKPPKGEIGTVSNSQPDKKNMMPKSPFARLAAGLLALSGTFAEAQPVAPAASSVQAQTTSLEPKPEAIVLSPFTVDTTRETGYAASSTLSGTRFNTALRDVSAPVSILTPEFMSDIGAHTMIEAASFAVSAEREPNSFDSSSNAPGSVRIRGLFVRSNSQDFFNTNFPLDDYNLEQISINRGPNSLLFGVGSPGGLVTGVTKRAGFTDRGSASLEVGSYRRVRGVFDLNRVLIPDRLALRLSVLHRDTDTFREATEWKDQRLFAALTWKINRRPNFQTTLRANYENGGADRVSGTLATPTDQISSWIAAGRPLVNGVRPATAGGLPTGVVSAAGQANIVVIDGSPQTVPILNWISTVRGSNPVPGGAGLGPTSPVGLNYNFNGPMRSVDYFGNSHSVFIEQQLGSNLFIELAGFHNALDNTWVREGGGGGALSVDANRLLPNGAPNPNAGQIYTEGTIRPQAQERLAEEVRLSVSYKLDLTPRSRWLGEHRLGLLLSERRDEFAFDDMQEVNTTPLPGYNARLDNAQNLIIRRSYLFQGQGNVWLGANRYPDVPFIDAGGIRSAFLPVQRIQRTKTLVDSKVLGTQSYLLDRRLVLTGGVRNDWNRGYTLDPAFAVRDARGVFPTWRTVPLTAKPSSDKKGNTFTFGAVAHLYKGVSLFYSRSESQDVADPREDWFGRALEVPTGFGRDLGLRFEGLGGRLTASIARFESGQNFQQNNKMTAWVARVNDMASILGRPELRVPVNGSDTQDLANRGWEFEAVFNPVKDWRIALNASRNESITSNAIPGAARFITERIFPLEAVYGSTVLTNGRTLSQEIVDLKNQILNNRDAVEGTPTAEIREWTANLVTNYKFSGGFAKGFFVGGYAQYRGPSALGATLNPNTGRLDPSRVIAGNDIWLLGLNLGYERRLAKGRVWSLRLGLANVLDNRELIEKNGDAASGTIVQWGVQAPRSWILRSSNTF